MLVDHATPPAALRFRATPPAGGRRVLLACAALMAAAVAGAATGGGEVLAPAAGAVVHAGDLVRVAWTPVPAGVEEFELLLSVDGGRTFPLRLTEMLDPRATSYAWRVPNLATAAARIRLRVGEDEEEIPLEPGPEFAIQGDEAAPAGRFTFRGGEWWTTEGIAVEPREVETEPSWSDGDGREAPSVSRAASLPNRCELRAPQAAAPTGHALAVPAAPAPETPVRDAGASISFPKRE